MIKGHDKCVGNIDLGVSVQPHTRRLYPSGHQARDVSRCQLKKKTRTKCSGIRSKGLDPNFKTQ